jgi:hypothetical protein
MDPENREAPASVPASSEADSAPPPAAEPRALAEEAAPDPAVLVERMVAAGEWPEPDLLEQIVQAGDAAVEPLLEILRTDPQGWPEDAPVSHAIGLVSMLRPPTAIPDLVGIITRYDEETGEDACLALEEFGLTGFETLVELCQDPGITGDQRINVTQSAIAAAGDDPVRRSRLAEVLRILLAQLMEKARKERQEKEASGGEDLVEAGPKQEVAERDEVGSETTAGGDDFDEELEDEEEYEGDSDEEDHSMTVAEIGFLVEDLAELADPMARDLIATAFAEGLVDQSYLSEESVEKLYQGRKEPSPQPGDWLSFYREDYEGHLKEVSASSSSTPDLQEEPAPPRPLLVETTEYPGMEPEEPWDQPVATPIRNVGPKLGRNDPCWCGSGKKYKKCHLGKDSLT